MVPMLEEIIVVLFRELCIKKNTEKVIEFFTKGTLSVYTTYFILQTAIDVMCCPELGRTSAVCVATLLVPHGPDLISRGH